MNRFCLLAAWAGRVQAQGWREAYVFFKHEDAGAGPRLAADFQEVFARAAERRPPLGAVGATWRREAG